MCPFSALPNASGSGEAEFSPKVTDCSSLTDRRGKPAWGSLSPAYQPAHCAKCNLSHRECFHSSPPLHTRASSPGKIQEIGEFQSHFFFFFNLNNGRRHPWHSKRKLGLGFCERWQQRGQMGEKGKE